MKLGKTLIIVLCLIALLIPTGVTFADVDLPDDGKPPDGNGAPDPPADPPADPVPEPDPDPEVIPIPRICPSTDYSGIG